MSDRSDSDDDEPPILVALEEEEGEEKAQPASSASFVHQQIAATHAPKTPPSADAALADDLLPPCPVTILSGFLGSGKTTLIQYILKSPDHGKRIAVIENEFGDGLSVESLIARDGINDYTEDNQEGGGTSSTTTTTTTTTRTRKSALQDLIELPNGCICCTVKDSLVATLERLITKRKDLDYILIEASGMANPGPIASVFWLDDELQSRIRLDGIVTLVDACHIHQQLEETYEASQQVAYADRILINKIDLLASSTSSSSSSHQSSSASASSGAITTTTATTARNGSNHNKHQSPRQRPSSRFRSGSTTTTTTTTTLDDVIASIRSIHPTAPYQTTTYSKVPDLDWILDAQCFGGKDRVQELDRLLNDAAAVMEDDEQQQQQQQHKEHLQQQHETHSHDHSHNHVHDESCGHHCDHTTSSSNNRAHEEHHRHTNAISTIALNQKGSVDLVKMNTWLAEILWPNQDAPNKVLKALLEEQEKELLTQDPPNSPLEKHVVSPESLQLHHQPQHQLSSQAKPPPKGQTIFRIKGILSVQHAADSTGCLDEEEIQQYLTPVVVQSTTTTTTTTTTTASSNVGNNTVTHFLDARRYIVQAVHDLWDIHPASNDLRWDRHDIVTAKDNSERCCKVVVIGRELNEADLKAGFLSCFV
jgi:G3E family GTPase